MSRLFGGICILLFVTHLCPALTEDYSKLTLKQIENVMQEVIDSKFGDGIAKCALTSLHQK